MQSHSDDVQMQVLNALHWDLAVPRNRLKVEVENGWVTMSGLVDLPYQRTCAEFDARNVPGVVGVINRIRLAAKEADIGRRRKPTLNRATASRRPTAMRAAHTVFSMPPSTK